MLCALFLCLPLLGFVFASFTFGFVHQLQTAEYTIFLVRKNISQWFRRYNDSLYYTCLFDLSQIKVRQSRIIFATRKWELFLHSAPLTGSADGERLERDTHLALWASLVQLWAHLAQLSVG